MVTAISCVATIFSMGETNQYLCPHPQQSPKQTKIWFYRSSPWEPMSLLGFLSEHRWGAAARAVVILKQHTGISPLSNRRQLPSSNRWSLPSYSLPSLPPLPHPRPQRPPATKAKGWESGWILRWDTNDSQYPASLRECQQSTARLWGAHTARLMTVTSLCWGLGRTALYSSTLSMTLMRASWTENRTQREKQGWGIFLNQLQRAGWEEFHENKGNKFGNHLSKIGEVPNKVWVQFPTRVGSTKVPE